MTLDLDAAGTTDANGNYRVEFFADDAADPSGYGEGQEYLGFINIANGNNQAVDFLLPFGTDLTGRVVTATTTAINNTTDSGFGATSEFSLAANVDVISPAVNNGGNGSSNNLANTGFNVIALSLLAGSLMIGGGVLATKKLRG
jgi:hypothetical protein